MGQMGKALDVGGGEWIYWVRSWLLEVDEWTC